MIAKMTGTKICKVLFLYNERKVDTFRFFHINAVCLTQPEEYEGVFGELTLFAHIIINKAPFCHQRKLIEIGMAMCRGIAERILKPTILFRTQIVFFKKTVSRSWQKLFRC